ncbi:MAG: hypothetical protein KatS3mg061_3238 [Dehalococcoidia bacterium]|nr:MAG: hypothetical protein KatS3mg061_3238 [Dehalococcoidia bacterium]
MDDRPRFAYQANTGVREVTLAIERGLLVARVFIPLLVAIAIFLFRQNLSYWIGVAGPPGAGRAVQPLGFCSPWSSGARAWPTPSASCLIP